jgi:hypothetical protein
MAWPFAMVRPAKPSPCPYQLAEPQVAACAGKEAMEREEREARMIVRSI